MIIYKCTNILNNKIYIGQTIGALQRRIVGHFKSGAYFYNALHKYGKQFFKWEILESCNTKEELNNAEIKYIKLFNSNDSDCGYNLTGGGEGTIGRVCSTSTKEKLRILNTGKKLSEEIKEKISQSCKGKNKWSLGKHLSGRTKNKISVATKGRNNPMYGKKGQKSIWFGKNHTEEAKKKMSESQIGKKKTDAHRLNMQGNKYLYTLISPNGIIYKNSKNLKQFCFEHNINYHSLTVRLSENKKMYNGWKIYKEIM